MNGEPAEYSPRLENMDCCAEDIRSGIDAVREALDGASPNWQEAEKMLHLLDTAFQEFKRNAGLCIVDACEADEWRQEHGRNRAALMGEI